MPKYLFKSHLNAEGVKGTMNDGGTGRRAAVEAALASIGGSLETMYYAFGGTDVYAIVDLPSDAHAVSAAAMVAASGTGSVETVVLIDPETVDEAAAIQADYRPPGG
jgi:uncharacterized protein with GYD domain